ncbi:MAG: hypothetical protein A2536_09295 [Candidatus Firestonebacteria bacterium RIFOXYD2_FULL_39_29]|nr:MAG: hypothetical protein A2536_09295 [Candidatus Firestonebacteria bacterium RIFOXYD2_FULL_39_29]
MDNTKKDILGRKKDKYCHEKLVLKLELRPRDSLSRRTGRGGRDCSAWFETEKMKNKYSNIDWRSHINQEI